LNTNYLRNGHRIYYLQIYVNASDILELSKCYKKEVTIFGSTYICEAGFSTITNTDLVAAVVPVKLYDIKLYDIIIIRYKCFSR